MATRFGASYGPHTQTFHHREYKVQYAKPPIFSGSSNPSDFLDWSLKLKQYFEDTLMPEHSKVRFTKCLLEGPAKFYWNNVERSLERDHRPPIERWDEMILELRSKYIPHCYQRILNDKLNSLTQGTSTVDAYMIKLEELLIRCDVRETASMTISRFRNGLRPEIKRGLTYFQIIDLNEAYQRAIEVERDLKQRREFQSTHPSFRNPNPTPSSSIPMKIKPAQAIESTRVTYHTCEQPDHIMSNCPKSVMIMTEKTQEHEAIPEEKLDQNFNYQNIEHSTKLAIHLNRDSFSLTKPIEIDPYNSKASESLELTLELKSCLGQTFELKGIDHVESTLQIEPSILGPTGSIESQLESSASTPIKEPIVGLFESQNIPKLSLESPLDLPQLKFGDFTIEDLPDGHLKPNIIGLTQPHLLTSIDLTLLDDRKPCLDPSPTTLELGDLEQSDSVEHLGPILPFELDLDPRP